MVASTPIVGLWLAGVVAATLAVLAWRERPTPGATPFSVAMVATAWWTVASVAGLAATAEWSRVAWANAEWIGIVLIPVAWLWFCIEYTGRDELVTVRNAAVVLAVPLCSVVVIWTDGIVHDLFRQSVETVAFSGGTLLETTPGPWYWIATGHSYLLTLAGMFLLTELWFGKGTRTQVQVGALILAAVVPAVVGLTFVGGLSPIEGFDPTPLAFVVSGLLLVGAVTKFGLFDTAPIPDRVARTEVVEGMDDAVLVVDSDGRIVDCNARGAAIVGCSTDDAIGLSARDRIPGYEAAVDGDSNTVTVSYERAESERYLDVRVTPFEGVDHRGSVVVLRDVTEDRRREQRLDVLNRVLRHNLRNDLNVVYGYAEYLDGTESYDETAVQKIKERSESLMSIGNKAREVEQFLGRDDPDPVEVGPLLEHEVYRLRDKYDAAEVIVDSIPTETRCPGTIGPVVRDLLENAVEHNPKPTPVVRIDAQRHGGELVVRVSDNGPGLPEEERSVLESGRETPLEHGSGLGLWLVVWGVREMNGTVNFDSRPEGGCTVTVRVPATDGTASAGSIPASDDDGEASDERVSPGETRIAGPD